MTDVNDPKPNPSILRMKLAKEMENKRSLESQAKFIEFRRTLCDSKIALLINELSASICVVKEAEKGEDAIIWEFVHLPAGIVTLAELRKGLLRPSRNVDVIGLWESPQAREILVKHDAESNKDFIISPEACLAKYAPKKQKMTEEKE